MPTTLYIDADACPVEEEAVRVAERHGLAIRFVSNAWMRLPESPLVERVVVAGGPDAADDCNYRPGLPTGGHSAASRARLPRMNDQLRPPSFPATTVAAEGLPRRRFTVAEMRAMTEAGILGDSERLELLGGEAVPMNPKGIQHERIKAALLRYWIKRAPDGIDIIPETTFTLSDDTFLEPDITVYTVPPGLADLRGDTALLCVEIADSTLAYDRGRKAAIYASFGVRDYWSIDAAALATRVHRDPGPDGYSTVLDVPASAELTPLLAPVLSVSLGQLILP